jgi:flagellar biosynthetic protein FlhB
MSAQMGGLIFSPDKLKPKWDKVSPMAGFKRIFGPDNFMHFGSRPWLKLMAVGLICWMVLKPHMREFENLAAMPPAAILPLARDLAISLMASALVFMGFAAGADFMWQKLALRRADEDVQGRAEGRLQAV